jgi:hypothetical protein
MMRKMLLIASAIAIPLGAIGVTAVAGSTMAGASNNTLLNITCHLSGATVTFAAPGLSANGTVSPNPTSTTTTSAQTLTCGTAGNGTSPGLSIVSASTPCTGTNTPITGCALGLFVQDSTAGFSSSGGTLAASIPKIKFTIGATTYVSKTTSSAGLVCTGGELGFVLKGKLKSPAAHVNELTKVTACLGTDTGTNTTGMFTNDFGAAGVTIATANLAADSKAKIS